MCDIRIAVPRYPAPDRVGTGGIGAAAETDRGTAGIYRRCDVRHVRIRHHGARDDRDAVGDGEGWSQLRGHGLCDRMAYSGHVRTEFLYRTPDQSIRRPEYHHDGNRPDVGGGAGQHDGQRAAAVLGRACSDRPGLELHVRRWFDAADRVLHAGGARQGAGAQ